MSPKDNQSHHSGSRSECNDREKYCLLCDRNDFTLKLFDGNVGEDLSIIFNIQVKKFKKSRKVCLQCLISIKLLKAFVQNQSEWKNCCKHIFNESTYFPELRKKYQHYVNRIKRNKETRKTSNNSSSCESPATKSDTKHLKCKLIETTQKIERIAKHSNEISATNSMDECKINLKHEMELSTKCKLNRRLTKHSIESLTKSNGIQRKRRSSQRQIQITSSEIEIKLPKINQLKPSNSNETGVEQIFISSKSPKSSKCLTNAFIELNGERIELPQSILNDRKMFRCVVKLNREPQTTKQPNTTIKRILRNQKCTKAVERHVQDEEYQIQYELADVNAATTISNKLVSTKLSNKYDNDRKNQIKSIQNIESTENNVEIVPENESSTKSIDELNECDAMTLNSLENYNSIESKAQFNHQTNKHNRKSLFQNTKSNTFANESLTMLKVNIDVNEKMDNENRSNSTKLLATPRVMTNTEGSLKMIHPNDIANVIKMTPTKQSNNADFKHKKRLNEIVDDTTIPTKKRFDENMATAEPMPNQTSETIEKPIDKRYFLAYVLVDKMDSINEMNQKSNAAIIDLQSNDNNDIENDLNTMEPLNHLNVIENYTNDIFVSKVNENVELMNVNADVGTGIGFESPATIDSTTSGYSSTKATSSVYLIDTESLAASCIRDHFSNDLNIIENSPIDEIRTQDICEMFNRQSDCTIIDNIQLTAATIDNVNDFYHNLDETNAYSMSLIRSKCDVKQIDTSIDLHEANLNFSLNNKLRGKLLRSDNPILNAVISSNENESFSLSVDSMVRSSDAISHRSTLNVLFSTPSKRNNLYLSNENVAIDEFIIESNQELLNADNFPTTTTTEDPNLDLYESLM